MVGLYARNLWSRMSPNGRMEVIKKFRGINGSDLDADWEGVSLVDILNISNIDELPGSLFGLLLLTAEEEGWDYSKYERLVRGS